MVSMVTYLTLPTCMCDWQADCKRLYEVTLSMIQTYAQHNIGESAVHHVSYTHFVNIGYDQIIYENHQLPFQY